MDDKMDNSMLELGSIEIDGVLLCVALEES